MHLATGMRPYPLELGRAYIVHSYKSILRRRDWVGRELEGKGKEKGWKNTKKMYPQHSVSRKRSVGPRINCNQSLVVAGLLTDAPRLTVLPRDQRVIDGSIASFLCRASGNPVPEVYWRRAGRRIAVGRQRYTVVSVPLGGSLLRIEPVKAARDDNTGVECVAENGIGEPVAATARLHVYLSGQGRC